MRIFTTWRPARIWLMAAALLIWSMCAAGCSDEDRCAGVTCAAGTCDPATGECLEPAACADDAGCDADADARDDGGADAEVDAPDACTDCPTGCQSNDDCVEGDLCVRPEGDSSGECRLAETACGNDNGDGGCPGNQQCDYDAAALRAECTEAGDCTTSLDCVGERRCAGRACVEPATCQPDSFEPNQDDAQATDFATVAVAGGLQATICADDVDVYTIDTRRLSADAVRGELAVAVDDVRRDVGLGRIDVELVDPDGASLDRADTGALGRDGHARVAAAISPTAHGVYTVRVRAGDDVTTAGLAYSLGVSFLGEPARDACAQAIPIHPQQTLDGDTRDATSYQFGSTCTAAANDASEDIYSFEVNQPSMVTLELTPEESTTDLTLSLRGECTRLDTELACVDERAGGDETLERLLDPGTYYAMVQAPPGGIGGAYSLGLTVANAFCSPRDNYCEDGDSAKICDEAGSQFVAQSCSHGCDPRTGRCARPRGDHCADPERHDADFTATIDWQALQNDYQRGGGHCVPAQQGDSQTDGADAVWAVEVAPHHAMHATLDLADGEQGSLYIFDDCLDPADSCVAGANAGDAAQETLGWVNDTDVAQTIYLVADSSAAGAMSSATLDVTIDSVVCATGDTRCDGDDLEQCNALGTGYDFAEACAFGCDVDVDDCVTPPNQSCHDAVALTSGQPAMGTIDRYGNDHEFSPAAAGCLGDAAAGPDATYKLNTTQPDQLVEVTVDAAFDAQIYVTRSCITGELRCLDGADHNVGAGVESLQFLAAEPGDYYIYVDAADPNASGAYTLSATATSPACTPGEVTGCQGGDLAYCGADGTAQTYSCSQASCSSAACTQPSGDVCPDPIVLADGDTLTDTLAGTNAVELPAGRSGRCAVDSGEGTVGPDNVYRVGLSAGDLLSVDLTTDDADMYAFILQNCAAPAVSCAAQTRRGVPGTMQYFAERDENVFVVVDSTRAVDTSQYTISAEITQGAACAPGHGRCAGASTLEVCARDGSGYAAPTNCAAGCADGGCVADTASAGLCATAPDVGDGIIVHADFDTLNNNVEAGPTSCVGEQTAGGDLTYAVSLEAGEVVRATMTSHGGERPAVYIIGDCAAPEASCQAAQTGGAASGYTARAHHLADTAQTVYVVADTVSASNDEDFTLAIDVAPAECTTTSQTSCVDASTQQTCVDGVIVQSPCYYGDCTGGSCPAPAHDLCSGAVVVPNDGQTHTYRGLTQDFGNEADFGRSGTCDGVSTPYGQDAFYAIDLAADDVVEVSVDSPGDAVAWLTSDCADTAGSCVGAAHTGASGSFIQQVSAAGTYYVVADHAVNAPDGEFIVDIRAHAPNCQAGATQCKNANTLQTCTQNATWSEQTCAYGCQQGACQDPANDVCWGAEQVSADASWHVITGPMGDYTNRVDQATNSATSCTGYETPGPDAFYAVNLAANEVVQAEWSSPADGAVWLASTCANTASACLIGDDSPGDPDSISYTANAAGTYYVVADNYSPSASGPFELRVRAGATNCNPRQFASLCLDSRTLQICEDPGFLTPIDCKRGCNSAKAACNTQCDVAPDLTGAAHASGGTQIIDAWDNYEAELDDACALDPVTSPGEDTVFRVDLRANETLDATISSPGYYPSLVLTRDCSFSTSACLRTTTGSSSTSNLSYTASSDETVYLLLDNDWPYGSGNFTLDVQVQ